jgi:hypothetical protein
MAGFFPRIDEKKAAPRWPTLRWVIAEFRWYAAGSLLGAVVFLAAIALAIVLR